MFLPHLLQSNAAKAAVATTGIAAVRDVTGPVVIEVSAGLYTACAVVLAMIGIYLARLVTIDAENKRLGRVQTLRETGPLTWIAVLIVGPLIWHWQVAVPVAPVIGLGVGYSVRAILKIFGGGAVASAKALLRGAAAAIDEQDTLADTPVPPAAETPDAIAQTKLLQQLDDVPATPIPPAHQ
jgi:hypothetical protein